MKTLIHTVLVVLFLGQAISTTVILVNFELNREEIARTLCEKKEEENNCCQGSCHLKKQLQAEEKKQQAPGQNFKQVKTFPLFHEKQSHFKFYASYSETDFMPFHSFKTNPFSLPVFHPPCCFA